MRVRHIFLWIIALISLTGCDRQRNVDEIAFSESSYIENSQEYVGIVESNENTANIVESIHYKSYGADTLSDVLAGEIVLIEMQSKVDMNGDGQEEVISLDVENMDEWGYRYRCTMSINDSVNVKENVLLDAEEKQLLYLFTPDGTSVALALLAYDGSYNEQTYVYFYNGQEIECCKLFGRPKYYDTEQKCLYVDTLVYQLQWHVTTRACNAVLIEDGRHEFVFLEGYSVYDTYYPDGRKNVALKLMADMVGYKDNSSDDVITIPAGHHIVVKGGDCKEWLHIYVVETEEELWLRIRNGIVVDDMGCSNMVNDYFENIVTVN